MPRLTALVLSVALLGCTDNRTLSGEYELTADVERVDEQVDRLANEVKRHVRGGKPSAEYVLKWSVEPTP